MKWSDCWWRCGSLVLGADFESSSAPCAFDELDTCDHLFVHEISEPYENSPRLIIREDRCQMCLCQSDLLVAT
jgi:hypothetical protein